MTDMTPEQTPAVVDPVEATPIAWQVCDLCGCVVALPATHAAAFHSNTPEA